MLFRSGGGGVSVSFYDFQYTGKATPAKDLAYCLICTAVDLSEAEQTTYLKRYLEILTPLLETQAITPPTFTELRAAYLLSVCDLARWMSGWGWLGHEGMMRQRCAAALQAIDGGRDLGSEDAYREAVFAAFPP